MITPVVGDKILIRESGVFIVDVIEGELVFATHTSNKLQITVHEQDLELKEGVFEFVGRK